MNISKNLHKKSLLNVFVLVIIAISVYIGFEPLIALVPDGVSKAVVSSSFGAIFVIILTMYLLNKQTEMEQESKKTEKLFDEKIEVFKHILQEVEKMIEDEHISSKEIKKLPFPFIKLCMLSDEKPILKFKEIFDKLNNIYGRANEEDYEKVSSKDNVKISSKDNVKISSEEQYDLIKMLFEFSSECRINLQVSSSKLDKTILDGAIEVVKDMEKNKKDFTKYKFKEKKLPKNRYIHAVIKNFLTKYPHSKEEFEKKIASKLPWHSSAWVTLEQAQEIENRDKKRHFMKGNEIIKLKDAEICISNGQSAKDMPKWIDLFKKLNIEYE